MAMDFNNLKERVLERMVEGMSMVDDSWSKIFKKYDQDGAGLRVAALTGIGDLPTWDGAAALTTASMDATGAKDYTYQARGLQVVINKYDARDIPSLVADASRKLGVSVASTYAEQAYTVLNGAFSSGSYATADTKALCAADHATTSTTRSNAGSAALSHASLAAAIQALNEWVNFQDQAYPLAMNGERLFLVVPPALFQTASEVARSEFTSESLQINAMRGLNIEVVQNPRLTDANDWFVCVDPMVAGGPLIFWERAPLEVDTVIDQDTKSIKINATFAIATDVHPQPDGIYGSSVA